MLGCTWKHDKIVKMVICKLAKSSEDMHPNNFRQFVSFVANVEITRNNGDIQGADKAPELIYFVVSQKILNRNP